MNSGEDLLSRSDDEDDEPFKPMEVCVLDDGEESFWYYYDEYDESNK